MRHELRVTGREECRPRRGRPWQVIASGVMAHDVTPEVVTYGNDFAPSVKQTPAPPPACAIGLCVASCKD